MLEPKDPDQDPLADAAAVSRTDPDTADPSDAPDVTGLGTYAENVEVQCSTDDYDFDDGIHETWSCMRLTEEGGSFIAYSR